MIFAAGLGTRLKPLTDTMPKALVPVAGKPLLAHVIEKLRQAEFTHIVINVHHFADQIIDYVQASHQFGIDIRISDEREQLLETGGGIKKAAPLFDVSKPILIHNVDILSNLDLADIYNKVGENDALLVVSERNTSRYLLFNEIQHLVGWTNISTGERRGPICDNPQTTVLRLAFSGIHVIGPRLLKRMNSYPERFPIIDFYLNECSSASIQAFVPSNLKMMDVGKLDTLHEADAFSQELNKQALL